MAKGGGYKTVPGFTPVWEEKGTSVAELCISSPHLASSSNNMCQCVAGQDQELGLDSCLPAAATHPPVSGLQVREWLGNSCHFLSMPYSGKINSQDVEPSRTLKLAEESTRVGVL